MSLTISLASIGASNMTFNTQIIIQDLPLLLPFDCVGTWLDGVKLSARPNQDY